MVFFNYALRKLNAKIVYYGPGLCGKTTNLQWIHDHFEGGQRGKMISLATEGDRTIFFDLLPIDIGTIRGMDVTLQLYTVPGQVHYNSTRQLVLRGADGVVFVADSQRTMRSSNAESFENLQENLMLQGIDLKDFPHILQFNKRDLRDLLSTEDLNENLNVFSVPIFEAIATEGIGVQESLEGIVKLVMRNLREKYEPVASATGPQAPSPMQVTGPMAFQPERSAGDAPRPPDSDFVAQVDPPPAENLPDAPEVPMTVAPATLDVPSMVAPPSDHTRDVGPDSGFASFQDEDGIPTAVYKPDDEEIVAHEKALGSSATGDDDFAFSADEKTPVGVPATDEPKEFEGLFTDPRDEDGTSESEVAPIPSFEVVEPEVRDDLTTDPEFIAESLEPDPPDENLDDLFEPEVPTVKAYVDEVMEVIETSGSDVMPDEPVPPMVDPSEMLVAPPSNDRFEDRIEAPGPFAPAAPSDTPAEPAEDFGDYPDEMHAEVRQALGASEDREALASLSVGEVEEADEIPEVEDISVEVPLVVVEEADEIPEVEDISVEVPLVVVEEADEIPEVEDISVEVPLVVVEEADEIPEVEDIPVEVRPVVPPLPVEPPRDEVSVEPETPDEVQTVMDDPEPADFEPVVDQPSFEAVVEVDASLVEPEPEEPEEPEPEELAVDEVVAPLPPAADEPIAKSRPIMVGFGDPFHSDDVDARTPEVVPPEAPIVPSSGAINVTAQDNQLHLQLKGSGAIAEMGQVRALDIEVPVPGEWVGNRKVTLQLRLTLTPAEYEDD